VPMPVLCRGSVGSVCASVVASLRACGARGSRIAMGAGVTGREACETRRDAAMARRHAAVPRRRCRRPPRVVTRSGHALESPDEAEGQ
jgi:hypothetical protein